MNKNLIIFCRTAIAPGAEKALHDADSPAANEQKCVQRRCKPPLRVYHIGDGFSTVSKKRGGQKKSRKKSLSACFNVCRFQLEQVSISFGTGVVFYWIQCRIFFGMSVVFYWTQCRKFLDRLLFFYVISKRPWQLCTATLYSSCLDRCHIL